MSKAMFKLAVYAVVVLGVIALCITLQQHIDSNADSARISGTTLSTTAITAATDWGNEFPSASSESTPTAQLVEGGDIDQSRQLPSTVKDRWVSDSFIASTLPSDQHDGKKPDSGIIDAQSPADAIGRPFPLADSVDAECKLLGQSFCLDLREALTQFAREPRDEAWAATMEEKVRTHLLTKGLGKDPIRALECRTSICAVECTAGYQELCYLEYEFTRAVGLLDHGGARGYEIDSSGSRIIVSVDAYSRREPLR